MVFEMQGKSRKYYHADCFAEHQADKQKRAEEAAKLDSLVETIKDIHGLISIPKQFYPFIQDMRNGTIRFQGKPIKKYKQGVPYEIIEQAYKLSKDSIHWSKENKNFKNSSGELRYGLAIVSNKINDASAYMRNRQKQQSAAAAMQKPSERKVEYKKRENKKDISDFLEEE